jgi:ATP-dependent helicase/nuclease subunit A
MAVRDLAALLAFIATPADDLSLAVALRSPLFGWSEAALHELAAGRAQGAALWSALLAMAERAVPIAAATVDVLHDLRDRSDFLRPFELIERMLTRHGGRRRLLARLGPEAEEGVDELLSQALAYERSAVPNLTGFLVWLQADTVDVRRQPDVAGRRLRVMTVHGAKGLEAPIVFLPDTADRQNRDRSDICFVADDVPVWKPSANMRPQAVQAAIDAELRRQEEERLRLLYVAMTRAESWLIVAAAGKLDKGDAWHDLVAQGLGELGALPHDFPTGPGLRLVSGEWPADAVVASAAAQSPAEPARRALTDDWADLHVPAVRHRPAWVTPTSLGGAKLILGADEADDPATIARNAEAAMARGTRIHLLLEHLPGVAVAARGDLAARLLADLPAEETRALVAEASALLDDPALAAIFAPAPGTEVFAEVALAAEMGDLPMIGIVDRLIVTPSEVIAVDYKTNRVVPEDAADIPEGILRQMAAYRAALGRILPGRKVATAVVWTARRLVQRPSDAQLDEALGRALAERAADLDVAEGDP